MSPAIGIRMVSSFAFNAKMKPQKSSCHHHLSTTNQSQLRISRSSNEGPTKICLCASISTLTSQLVVVLALGCIVVHQVAMQPSPPRSPHFNQAYENQMKVDDYFENLFKSDKCGTVYTSKKHGYDIRDYSIITNDHYKLKIHRLIHPEDFKSSQHGGRTGRADIVPSHKKSYLLVHGLIGTSASFVLNVKDGYQAPKETFQAEKYIKSEPHAKAAMYGHEWQDVASKYLHKSSTKKYDVKMPKIFADLNEIIYNEDPTNFGPRYQQVYRQFSLPENALHYTTNSLAFTLSNFGYDVWMVNLRGNDYSKDYNGPQSAVKEEYWDFKIENIVKEDLMAAIELIMDTKRSKNPIGIVTFSYSSAYVMNLLKSFPVYFTRLEPIVMLAPTLMTNSPDRKTLTKGALQLMNILLRKNGPFPTIDPTLNSKGSNRLSRIKISNLDNKIKKVICSLPIASKVCSFMEAIIFGETQEMSNPRRLLWRDRESIVLRQRDTQCGRTSIAILHQIFDNVRRANIPVGFMLHPKYQPVRRSVILIHSDSDEVATPNEVERIRSTALKTITLLDYTIKTEFSHSDFLFSKKNQYLVNAEVVRQVLAYDFLVRSDYIQSEQNNIPPGGY